MALRSLASRTRGSALQVRAAAPRASPPAPCPCARPSLQGGQQSKAVDLYPARPIDLLPEAKWMNVKEDGAVRYGAALHTSAPRVPPPAPRTTTLAGGQPVLCRGTSLQGGQQRKGVDLYPARPIDLLPEAKNVKEDGAVRYGAGLHTSAPRVPPSAPRTTPLAGGQPVLCRSTSSSQTCFGRGQQRRGVAQMPFQSLDRKTAAAMYDQLSPEGRRVASLANMAGNEAVRKMELWNKQQFDSVDVGIKELIDKVTVLGSRCVYAVAAASCVFWYVYVVIKEGETVLGGKHGSEDSAEWLETSGKKKQAEEKGEASAK